MADPGQESSPGLALALGQQALLAGLLGVAGVGDVPVDADAAHGAAGLVAHRGGARGQPALCAVGPDHPKLDVAGAVIAHRGLQLPAHEIPVGGVHPFAHLVGRHQRWFAVDAAQAEHLCVPPAGAGLDVGLPGADARATRGQRRALVGFAQAVFGGMALGHVQHHTGELALAGAGAHRRAGGQAAHLAVWLDDAQVHVEQALIALEQHVDIAAHRCAVGVMHVQVQILAKRGRLEVVCQAMQLAHLRVPVQLLRGIKFCAPHPHTGGGRGHLQALRQRQSLLLGVEAVAEVEHHAHLAQHLALGIALPHAAGKQNTPAPVGAAAAQLQVAGRVAAGALVGVRCRHCLGVIQQGLQPQLAGAVELCHHQRQRQAARLRRQAQQGPAQGAGAQQASGPFVFPDGDVGKRQHQIQLRLRAAGALGQAECVGVVEDDALGMHRPTVHISHHPPQRANVTFHTGRVDHPKALRVAPWCGHGQPVHGQGLGAVVGVDRLHGELQCQRTGLRALAPEPPHLVVPVAFARAQVVGPGAKVRQLLRAVEP